MQKGRPIIPRVLQLLSTIHTGLWTHRQTTHKPHRENDWIWEGAQNDAFLALKEAIVTAPVLILPDENSPYRVKCNALDYALGAVLSQERDGKWHPVAFLSKAMTDTEQNYEIYDKELLTVMTALSEWRHFLMGSKYTFKVWNDHKNLEYLRKPQKLNRRQA